MMGDNRDNSSDSRVVGGVVGYVPPENLIGRAEIIFFSIERGRRGMADLALAEDGALEPFVPERPLSGRAGDAR